MENKDLFSELRMIEFPGWDYPEYWPEDDNESLTD